MFLDSETSSAAKELMTWFIVLCSVNHPIPLKIHIGVLVVWYGPSTGTGIHAVIRKPPQLFFAFQHQLWSVQQHAGWGQAPMESIVCVQEHLHQNFSQLAHQVGQIYKSGFMNQCVFTSRQKAVHNETLIKGTWLYLCHETSSQR